MKMTMARPLLFAALVMAAASAAQAQGITDPIGDFLPTYVGPKNGDVDVVSAFAGYDPGSNRFSFSGTFAGAIGTTPGAFYVWGLNRGVGSERFTAGSPSVGQGVLFDAVVFLRPDSTARVIRFVGTTNTFTELAAGTATISGNTISGSIDGSLLPSTGFTSANYTWNLWPRTGGTNDTIADFAPNGSNVQVSAVPEPETYALFAAGLGMLGLARRRRKVS